jgi:opine dehydrogenase
MNQKPIAVLGGGAGAHMMAVDLTDRGYRVHLCEHPDFEASFQTTLRAQAIEAVGIGPRGTYHIHRASTDIASAVEEAEWVNVVMPAVGHDLFFGAIVPHLRDGHKVVTWAGDFGSLRLRRMLLEAGKRDGVTVIETNTLPYGTRIVEPGRISLLCIAPHVMAAALPSGRTGEAVKELREMFPCISQAPNVLAAAFNNPNPIVHPPGSLLNTGRIEHSRGEFYMYREGITESVARVIREVYEESRRVARAFDFDMTEYRDADFRTTCSIMGVEFVAPFDTAGVIASILGPRSVRDRYITEDLPFGLVPRSQLGDVVSVATPVMDGFVSIGCVVCQEDYWQTGRTLEKLGLGGLDRDGILEAVRG